MLIVDSHLDLAHNALEWDRDLTKPVAEIRKDEAGMSGKARGQGTVAYPELRVGKVGLFFCTVHCRLASCEGKFAGVRTQDIAYAKAQAEAAYYRLMEQKGILRKVVDRESLDAHLEDWERNPDGTPFGYVLSMEGADPIVSPDQVPEWWDIGLRIVSLVHYGVSTYAHGTQTEGGLLPAARALLEAMEEVGMILDLTHTSEGSFWEELDTFNGPVIATHNCCRALVPHDRQFTDEQIRAIIQCDGVIGVALDDWMLDPLFDPENADNSRVTLSTVVDHIDHICQLAGNANHAAIGSDLDGGYGKEQSPYDLDTIADFQNIPKILEDRGHSEGHISNICHGNWIRLLRRVWDSD